MLLLYKQIAIFDAHRFQVRNHIKLLTQDVLSIILPDDLEVILLEQGMFARNKELCSGLQTVARQVCGVGDVRSRVNEPRIGVGVGQELAVGVRVGVRTRHNSTTL